MISFLVLCLFVLYVLLVLLFGHHWRRWGGQFIEYIAGALIVVLCARWQLDVTPGADWFEVITRHYGIAGLLVIPMEIGLAIRGKRAAARQIEADRAE